MDELSREETAQRIRDLGLIAIIRGHYTPARLRSIAQALIEGGVRLVEVTLNSEHALDGITALRKHLGDKSLVGAGTVRTKADVDRALNAGAQFLMSPNFDPQSVARALDADILHIPGVFTPSEAQRAFAAGCRIQKLFPADQAGPSYLKALNGPLDDIEFVPTGGIAPDRIPSFVDAGAVAFGVASALISGPEQSTDEVRARAGQLVATLGKARGIGD